MKKLLPCPNCKDSWLFVSKYDYGSDYENLGYQGTCKCGKFNKKVTWNKTKEQAVEEWNSLIESEAKVGVAPYIKYQIEEFIVTENSEGTD